jgi:hypothetical protein
MQKGFLVRKNHFHAPRIITHLCGSASFASPHHQVLTVSNLASPQTPINRPQLWFAYLKERHEAVRGLCVTHPAYAALNNTFERALVTMHKMPKVWELYLHFLVEQRGITKVRRACDRSLASLPVTQHERIWTIYLVLPGSPAGRTHPTLKHPPAPPLWTV